MLWCIRVYVDTGVAHHACGGVRKIMKPDSHTETYVCFHSVGGMLGAPFPYAA